MKRSTVLLALAATLVPALQAAALPDSVPAGASVAPSLSAPALAAAAGQDYYRSNEFGLMLEKIPPYRRDECTWLMVVERKDGREIRILYDHGREVRSWVRALAQDGTPTEEREYEGKHLVTRRFFGKKGQLIQEETWAGDSLVQKLVYSWSGAHLRAVHAFDGKGKTLSTDEFQLSAKGALRRFRRSYADGASAGSWYMHGSEGVSEERERIGDTAYVIRYDQLARAIAKRQIADGKPVKGEDFVYNEDSKVASSSTTEDYLAGSTVIRDFTEAGGLQKETVTVSEKRTEQTDFTRDDRGNVVSKRRRSARGIEEWRYSYDAQGNVARESYLKKGSLEKVTLFSGKDERVEVLYKDGAPFLRVSYTQDKKTKEEVILDGKVVKERVFP